MAQPTTTQTHNTTDRVFVNKKENCVRRKVEDTQQFPFSLEVHNHEQYIKVKNIKTLTATKKCHC